MPDAINAKLYIENINHNKITLQKVVAKHSEVFKEQTSQNSSHERHSELSTISGI